MREHPVPTALKKLYRRWIGELVWIEAPPKTMARVSRNRDQFNATAAGRSARAEEIRRGIPHIVAVIRIYDPVWNPDEAKPIRPKLEAAAKPPQGWAAAAIDVMRQTRTPLTISEILDTILEWYGLELKTSAERQGRRNAIAAALSRTYQEIIVGDDSTPCRWSLK